MPGYGGYNPYTSFGGKKKSKSKTTKPGTGGGYQHPKPKPKPKPQGSPHGGGLGSPPPKPKPKPTTGTTKPGTGGGYQHPKPKPKPKPDSNGGGGNDGGGLGSKPKDKKKHKWMTRFYNKESFLNTPTKSLLSYFTTPFSSKKIGRNYFRKDEDSFILNNLRKSIINQKNKEGQFEYTSDPGSLVQNLKSTGLMKAAFTQSTPEAQVYTTLGKADYTYDPATNEYVVGGKTGGGKFDFDIGKVEGKPLKQIAKYATDFFNQGGDVIELRYSAEELGL